MPIKQIIIAGDWLRPSTEKILGNQNSNIQFFFNIFSYQIHKASGIVPKLLLDPIHDTTAFQYYQERNITNYMSEWIKLYEQTDHLEDLSTIYSPYLQDSLFIGFELPPYLRTILLNHQVPFIDFRIHPIRFLDDLLFAVKSTSDEVQVILQRKSIHEDRLYIAAHLCKAVSSTQPRMMLNESKNYLLVAGQCTYDATQITQGRLFDITQRKEHIKTICTAYDIILLKPHPADKTYPLIQYLKIKCLIHNGSMIIVTFYSVMMQSKDCWRSIQA